MWRPVPSLSVLALALAALAALAGCSVGDGLVDNKKCDPNAPKDRQCVKGYMPVQEQEGCFCRPVNTSPLRSRPLGALPAANPRMVPPRMVPPRLVPPRLVPPRLVPPRVVAPAVDSSELLLRRLGVLEQR